MKFRGNHTRLRQTRTAPLFLAGLLSSLHPTGPAHGVTLEELDAKVEALASTLGAPTAGRSPATVGGYGELHYNNFADERDDGSQGRNDEIDLHRFVLFFGYRFTDTISFHSELEVEHTVSGGDAPGEVELEQAYVDWAINPHFGVRGGVMLVPVGILNRTHEPPTFYGVERNLVETRIIPTTWWEAGVGAFGEIVEGLAYQVNLHSGLELEPGMDARGGMRDWRQKAARANAERLAVSAALDYSAIPWLSTGIGLFYQGDLTQGSGADVSALLTEVHAQVDVAGFEGRAIYARWDVDGADDFFADGGGQIAEEQSGYLLEGAYRFGRHVLPEGQDAGAFVRYESLDTNDGLPTGVAHKDSAEQQAWTVGLNFWPTDLVVVKVDYQNVEDEADTGQDSWNLGLGWWF
ncbi:MAG TPA: porin [bacterium]|jgi:phosphate-selective porin